MKVVAAPFVRLFAMAAGEAAGVNVMTDAFGLVSLVAMMPLITVQVMGAVYLIRSRRRQEVLDVTQLADNEIIELWEVAS